MEKSAPSPTSWLPRVPPGVHPGKPAAKPSVYTIEAAPEQRYAAPQHEDHSVAAPTGDLHCLLIDVDGAAGGVAAGTAYPADHYSCAPPPVFLIIVTLIELSSFIYYACTSSSQVGATGPVPIDSWFIYRPDKRDEVWRFLLYIVLHAGWVHLMFNLLVQLLVGLPLEMVHGSLRVAIIYMSGVLAGSLGTSVFDSDVYLVGASGGVYALLAAHMANVLLNYSHMACGILRVAGVIVVASADIVFAVYDRHNQPQVYSAAGVGAGVGAPGALGAGALGAGAGALGAQVTAPPISYVAHITGAFAGLTVGLVVLKKFQDPLQHSKHSEHSQHASKSTIYSTSSVVLHYLGMLSLGAYITYTGFAILWNLVH